ncbi:MAG: peptidase dimerization domain-containing protein [Bradyrhizobium sp.]
MTYRFEVKNRGGHSAVPMKDNAIYRLAEGLTRLSKFDFSAKAQRNHAGLFSSVRRNLRAVRPQPDMHAIVGDRPDQASLTRLTVNPFYNAILRTTCVATMLEGGQAFNALPQLAGARRSIAG